jgi:hypothetical protein
MFFRCRGNRVGEYLWEKEMERLEQAQKQAHKQPAQHMSGSQAARELAVTALAGAAVCGGIIMLFVIF